MAIGNRALDKVETLGKGRVVLACTLLGAGAAAPTVEYGDMGFTVTRNDVGDYTLEFPGRGSMKLLSLALTFEGAAHKDVSLSGRDLAARTVDIRVETPSTDALAAAPFELADGADRVHVLAVLKNTGITGNR